MANIRNFCIIAHIDHGKSTLADRFLEITGTIEKRQMKAQYLDQLELERERGITIKMAPVRMTYKLTTNDQRPEAVNQKSSVVSRESSSSEYILNLIDTPGHPDFGYEVSRALEAVEGAILLVDGTQGIQAQTLSSFYAAKKSGLKIIGAVNKVDLFQQTRTETDITRTVSDIAQTGAESSRLDSVIEDLAYLIDCSPEEIHKISGKTGQGVRELLNDIVARVPSPQAYLEKSQQLSVSSRQLSVFSRALIFDSFYDDHKGIIASVRVFDGEFTQLEDVFLIAAREKFRVKEVGYFSPSLVAGKKLAEGEIGYLVTGIRDPHKIKIGDTIISLKARPRINTDKTQTVTDDSQLLSVSSRSLSVPQLALPGYKEPKPVVFVSFYPGNPDEYDDLKKSLERLKLNDSSFTFEPDLNEVLGRGFKGGFLGKLHFEIILQRLEKEFGIKTITSFPSVAYRIKISESHKKHISLESEEDSNGKYFVVKNPGDLPDEFDGIWEPMIKVEIISPRHLLGTVLKLKEDFRWQDIFSEQLSEKIIVKTRMPLAELISDFDDRLKSISGGFASFSYEEDGYQKSDLAKIDVLVAGEIVPGLSRILPKKNIERESRKIILRLKETLPRQQFVQAVQARALGRIIARENIPALKKDVTGYLYGGDRTRKMKLWKKQQRGKKKLLSLARVRISPEDFKKLLSK